MSWDVRKDDWLEEPTAILGSGPIDEFDAQVLAVVELFRVGSSPVAEPAVAAGPPPEAASVDAETAVALESTAEAHPEDRIEIELQTPARPTAAAVNPTTPEPPVERVAESAPAAAPVSDTAEPAADPSAEPSADPGFHIPTLSLGAQPAVAEQQPTAVAEDAGFVIPVLSRAEGGSAPVVQSSVGADVYDDDDGSELPEPGRPEPVQHVDSSELELVAEEESPDPEPEPEPSGFVIPTLARPASDSPEPEPEPESELAITIPTLTRPEPEAPIAGADEPSEPEPEPELASPVEVTQTDELDEADELEEVDDDAIDLDSADLVEVDRPIQAAEIIRDIKGVKETRPPSPPPEARPQPKRRKAWYDDVFGDHFLFLAPPTWDETAQRDAQFIHKQLGLPDGGTVLDVGCGDGRHAIELAKLGLRVFGLDNSLSMLLAAAQNKEIAGVDDTQVSFMHGDMRRLPQDREFDAVICVGTTLGYFEEEQNRQCLQEMADRLVVGGKLLLHVFNRDFVAPHLPSRSWWQGRRCMVIDEAEMNFFASRLRVHRTIIFDDGRQYEHFMFMRAYTVQDLGKAISACGLRVVEVSGSRDTRGRFFGSASPDIWILAERK